MLIAKPFSMVLRFFPPLVTGVVITIIGLSLIGADVNLIAGDSTSKDFGQPSHIGLAALVVLFIVLISRFFRGFIGQTSVLISIVLGCLVAWPMGLLHFPDVSSAKWVGFPSPFHFGAPKFAAAAIISMCIVVLVTYTESTADMLAVAEMVDKELSPSDLARGLATDGLSAILAGFFNSFPDTAYAENVGLIGMTKVKSRWVVSVCGALLLVLGLIPKVGAIVSDLPGPVIGGAATVMFAMVTAIGIRTLHKVEFEDNHNLLIVAVSLSLGMIPTIAPTFYEQFPKNFQIIFGSAITSTVIAVFVSQHLVQRVRARSPSAARRAWSGTALGVNAVVAETDSEPTPALTPHPHLPVRDLGRFRGTSRNRPRSRPGLTRQRAGGDDYCRAP